MFCQFRDQNIFNGDRLKISVYYRGEESQKSFLKQYEDIILKNYCINGKYRVCMEDISFFQTTPHVYIQKKEYSDTSIDVKDCFTEKTWISVPKFLKEFNRYLPLDFTYFKDNIDKAYSDFVNKNYNLEIYKSSNLFSLKNKTFLSGTLSRYTDCELSRSKRTIPSELLEIIVNIHSLHDVFYLINIPKSTRKYYNSVEEYGDDENSYDSNAEMEGYGDLYDEEDTEDEDNSGRGLYGYNDSQ